MFLQITSAALEKHDIDKLTICWVPGHANVAGNESVDAEAKKVVEGNSSAWKVLNINYCCGLFTDYISARAHYSRLCSTLVPSVACQTTEVTYRSPILSFLQAKPCADHHLSIGYEPWL